MAGFVVLGSAGATPVAPAALACVALDGATCLAAARANPVTGSTQEESPSRGGAFFLVEMAGFAAALRLNRKTPMVS
jgi:hypothetical protein